MTSDLIDQAVEAIHIQALGAWLDENYDLVQTALMAVENDWRIQTLKLRDAYLAEHRVGEQVSAPVAIGHANEVHRAWQRKRTELENLYAGLPADAS